MHKIPLLIAAAIAAASPTAATAATDVTGPTSLTLTGKAAGDLRRSHVKVVAKGGAEPVTGNDAPKYVLPASAASFGSRRTTLKHGGSLTFTRTDRGRTRKVLVRKLEVRLGKRSSLRAKVGGKSITFATLDLRRREYTADAATSTVRFAAVRLTLTRRAASALRRGLKLPRLRRSGFGVLAASAAAPGQPGPGTAPGVLPSPAAPAPAPAPPISGARPLAALPPLRWHVRESWIRYIATGEGTAASGGAVAGPPSGGLVYDYDFTPLPAQSWWDAAAQRGSFAFQGTLHFRFTAHDLDVSIANPKLVIDAGASHVTATFGSGKAGAYNGPGTLATLSLAAAQSGGVGAPAQRLAGLPLALTDWANTNVFSGFYGAGNNDFGTFDLGFTPG